MGTRSLRKFHSLTWLAVAFVLIIGIAYFAFQSHTSFRTILMENFNLQQKLVVTSMGDLVRNHLDEARQNLDFVARMLKENDRDPRDILSSIYQGR
jgi:hypothetical protein